MLVMVTYYIHNQIIFIALKSMNFKQIAMVSKTLNDLNDISDWQPAV